MARRKQLVRKQTMPDRMLLRLPKGTLELIARQCAGLLTQSEYIRTIVLEAVEGIEEERMAAPEQDRNHG